MRFTRFVHNYKKVTRIKPNPGFISGDIFLAKVMDVADPKGHHSTTGAPGHHMTRVMVVDTHS